MEANLRVQGDLLRNERENFGVQQLDISPLLFECYPYVGNVRVIRSEGGLPSVVRVGVIALIRNNRGG